ncbi:F-box/FBD/LRR-repeat protein-like protein [Tanacetum coccineum]
MGVGLIIEVENDKIVNTKWGAPPSFGMLCKLGHLVGNKCDTPKKKGAQQAVGRGCDDSGGCREVVSAKRWRQGNGGTVGPKFLILSLLRRCLKYQLMRLSSSILDQSFEHPSKRQKMNKKSKLMYAICQVLLMHDGPLREFSLSLLPDVSLAKIDHIMFHLSKKTTVKTLKLEFHSMRYRLPYSLFSFRQLTDLRLIGCTFNHQPIFSGLDSLTTLFMDGVCIHKATLIHLLSNCPLLKTLSFLHDRVPREFPTALNHLKCLCIDLVQFTHKDVLSILVLVIKSSPYLEKLRVLDDYWDMRSRRSDSFTPEDYSDVKLEHLNELKITDRIYRNRKRQLDFVKLILAKSPVLKKVKIFLSKEVSKKKESQISGILMGSPCTSPDVRITFEESELCE